MRGLLLPPGWTPETPPLSPAPFIPACVRQREKEYIVRADIPGVKKVRACVCGGAEPAA